MDTLWIGTVFFLCLAVWLSVRFVFLRRLGIPWLLVSAAIIAMGSLEGYAHLVLVDPAEAAMDPGVETIKCTVALLLACGFALTDRWFCLKERLEGRFGLIAEVDRSLVGVLVKETILEVVCEVLSRQAGYRLVWVGVGAPDGSVSVARSAGEDAASLMDVPIRWDDTPAGRGPTGQALRTGKACLANGFARTLPVPKWRRICRERGFRSGLSVPIDYGGRDPMALTVYAGGRSAFDRLEQEALCAMANRVGAAIQVATRHQFFVSAKGAYDDLLRAQRDGVLCVRGGRIVRANPAAAAMLGYPDAAGLVHKDPVATLLGPEAPPRLRRLLVSDQDVGVGTGGDGVWETVLRRMDGSSLHGEITVSWVAREPEHARDLAAVNRGPEYGGPLGLIVLRDITHRMQVQDERRRLEQQIIEMQKMEAVGTLAGGVAHDFNNILTGILGNLDVLSGTLLADTPEGLAVLESIKSSERAANLVRQLLDFSRRSLSERRPVHLGKVLVEVVHLLAQTIDKRISVAVDAPDDLWVAMADSNQVHQVLMNLCLNARDAILECLNGKAEEARPPGGYRIDIRAGNAVVGDEYRRVYPYARAGEFVVLSISDNGAGMDEATQRRIFEPFFTTKKLGRGTGLGLSTVYGIIKQHEGWINLHSEPGKGTTFYAFFPKASEPAEEEKTVSLEPGRPDGGKETILLVDDEEMIRNLGQHILELHGYTVLTAVDGQDAIDRYRENRNRIDVVILDLTMPYLSGTEVLGHIREINPRAKVILSSGYLSEGDVANPGCQEATAFLQKPYRAAVLTRLVREILDQPQ